MADRIIQRRIATDRAYRNAENAEEQAAREDTIASDVWDDLESRWEIA
jgi:hypothetical protein